jgi:hypothetical protein
LRFQRTISESSDAAFHSPGQTRPSSFTCVMMVCVIGGVETRGEIAMQALRSQRAA